MDNIYVLAIDGISFGEWSICGVYSDKKLLIEEYNRVKALAEKRDVYIYCFPMNQFIGSTPDWNDNKIYIDESPYLIDIDELI